MSELLFREETYRIIGICMQVHKELGMGLKEVNYKDAMEIEFRENSIPYKREKRFVVMYKDVQLRSPYIADFMLFDKIIVEVKSATAIIDNHVAQAISYLNVSRSRLALIINFGER